MAFNDIEKKRYERIVNAYVQKRRPPPHIRKEVDLFSRVYNQSVEIYEIRPAWDDPSDRIEIPIVKNHLHQEPEHVETLLAEARSKVASL